MKLYIAYYESYVSIIEGKYNFKKNKFNIKNCTLLSKDDVKLGSDDKYALLEEALKMNKSKVKDVVLCLNTKDVIIKSADINKVSPKDLDGIMKNEIDDMMSLDYDDYTFSYEVIKETVKEDGENLNLIIAAIVNEEIEKILSIFKEYKLNLERIDTMSTSYERFLKNIKEDNIMMLNIGSYGSIVNIFKEEELFIHDNIPVKITENSNEHVYLALVEEVKGLMNYYSSRNYGNNIDNIVILGESNNNKNVKDIFIENFSSKIVDRVENLFDIESNILGELNSCDISKVCDILGSMYVDEKSKSYSSMNLLPHSIKSKKKLKDNIKKYLSISPIGLIILLAPAIIFGIMTTNIEKKTEEKQIQLDKMLEQYTKVEQTQKEIKKVQEELDIYNMLIGKEPKWGKVLKSIDDSIPYRVDLTNLNVYYTPKALETEDNSTQEETEESKEETPIYDQVPNTIKIEGEAKNSYYVGQFVHNLNQISYFKKVNLKSAKKSENDEKLRFLMILELKEGVVYGE